MAKIAHTMIRVVSEEQSVAFYRDAFSLDVAERVAFDDFTLIYLRNAELDFELELTVNNGRTEPYNLGDGYGHLAFVTGDLESERRRIEAMGCRPGVIKEFHHDGSLMAKFFFVEDPDGYKIEVLQKHGRYK